MHKHVQLSERLYAELCWRTAGHDGILTVCSLKRAAESLPMWQAKLYVPEPG